jgi:SnoaL-like domain
LFGTHAQLRVVGTLSYGAPVEGANAMEIADKLAIAEIIHAWGMYRDQGKWKELRATFTSEGHISLSWFRGPFEQFVERARAGFGAGRTWSRHHLFTPMITLNKDRAIAETPVIIRVRQQLGNVEVDLTSSSRFLDRVERHAGGWLIAERAAIYERDRLDAVEPSPEFDTLFEAAETAHYPEQYRYMAFRIAHAEGRSLAPVIYRDGGPETVDLYARYSKWPAGGTA